MKMKILLGTIMLAIFAAPGSAEVKIKDLKVDKKSPSVVVTTVDRGQRWNGPYTTQVFVRPNDKSSWILVRTYTDMTAAPDQEVRHEITSNSSPKLMEVSQDDHWEARAVVKNSSELCVADKSEPHHYWDHADRMWEKDDR
jgi:hypothetical protein